MSYDIENSEKIYKKIKPLLRIKYSKNYIENANEVINKYDSCSSEWKVIDENRSNNRYWHGHVFIGDIIKSYRFTKDNSYLIKGIEIINSWINEFNYKYENEIAYHDETIALRINNWIEFILCSENILDKNSTILLKKCIKETVNLIAKGKFYRENTNHAMFQDITLLIYSEVFKNNSDVNKISKIAHKRLYNYFKNIYTLDGVHKEHTPQYHYIVTRNMYQIYNVFKDDTLTCDYLYNLYLNTLKFSYNILKPDGTFPQIGDNECIKVIDNISLYKLYSDPRYEYSISCGEKGIKPQENIVVFKDAGYAIFRNSWDKKNKALYILFTAAYHGSYHKHSDDLSILIYKDGDVFIDAGCRGYDYYNKYTQYGYSGFAHNSLIVDDSSKLYTKDCKYEKVRIKDYDIEGDVPYVIGVNERYEDVVHERKVQYNKSNELITIIDNIKSINKHNYKMLFNLAKNIEFVVKDKIILLEKDGANIGELRFKCTSEYKINKYFGKDENGLKEDEIIYPVLKRQIINHTKDKCLKGWHFPSKLMQDKNIVLEIECECESFKLETEILLYN
ncbi:heparinase II/III domain-containing protein [Romboutsia lituseburensis]|uniref:Heparinase II/III N-terminus n=1 Tax=Romboutsia lituseburensis DSM 797 TaxID=1121325 RepID=A0A1G9KC80_9FIRM|nr:heparinase II/III family protein [Romboutsia lituseburensis]CEH34849.1 Heparinase II/III protein [Romboutsia lituseburensis]SDL47189.1 Heparinase II/III N-terminus [Romboutsia lituseburensis DSM 797]